MDLSKILKPEAVKVVSSASSKKRLLHAIGEVAESAYGLDASRVVEALLERENLGPTGVGHGVALPHARLEGLSSVVGAFVRLEKPVDFNAVDRQPVDIAFAEELGYRIKLLGISSVTDHGVERRVHPCMVPLGAPIAHIDGVFNAVVADGDFVDTIMQEGRGAGEKPTASAVVADIVDIACGRRAPTFGVPATALEPMAAATMDRHVGAYYIRVMVLDRPGVFAEIASALRDHAVSMEAVLQRGRAPGEAVPVVMTTHDTDEAAMRGALGQIGALESCAEEPVMIRIEPF